jgi:hypothetical protein
MVSTLSKINIHLPAVVVQSCKPITQESEAGGLGVQGQFELQILSQKKKKKKKQEPGSVAQIYSPSHYGGRDQED